MIAATPPTAPGDTLGSPTTTVLFVCFAQLTSKTLDERSQVGIGRCAAGQLLGVFEGGRKIPSVAVEADEREQGVAVALMASQAFFQHCQRLAIAAELPIEIGEVDHRGRVVRAQPKRRLVFGLGVAPATALRIKISQRGTRLGSIGIETLGGNELGRRALETLAIGGRLARVRDRR